MTQPATVTSRKARQILTGARAAFLELGYEGTSVDEIARRAGVSKATLYSHFADKQALFIAFIKEDCQEQARRLVHVEPTDGTAAQTLRRIAHDYISFLFSSFALDMFRLVVAESQRFPDIGREFYQSGPAVALGRLAGFLAEAGAKKELRVDKPELAAHQFVALCRSEPFYQRLLGITASVAPEEVDRLAEVAVNTFLKIYGPG